MNSELEQQQPATAFHAPARIPLGGPFDELAARTAPHHAAGSIMPNSDSLPCFAAALPPAFERHAARCRTLPTL